MQEIKNEPQITRIKIDAVDIFLEEIGVNQGKITISGFGHNYCYCWGAMGGTLKDFLCKIDSGYFCCKLMDHDKWEVIDVKKTFAAIRKHIREEMNLPWWKHKQFQMDMREKLRDFELRMEQYEDERYLVDHFFSFVKELYFDLIQDKYERKRLSDDFLGGFSDEPWHYAVKKQSPEYKWLAKLHKQLIKELSKLPNKKNAK